MKRPRASAASTGCPQYDAGVLTASRELADYYETVVRRLGGQPKLAANWVMGDLSGALNRENLDVAQSKVGAEALAGLLGRIVDDTISGKIAKEVFEAMWAEGRSADAIIEAQGLKQITDTSMIERAIDDVMAKNPRPARGLPRRQGQAVRLLRRPGHEGHGGQGKPCPVERVAEAQAVELRRVTP